MSNSEKSFDSICASAVPFDNAKVHSLPIHPNTSFQFNSMEEAIDIFKGKNTGYVYSRYANPTTKAVADKLARLETYASQIEAQAYLCASGMSAISTLMLSISKPGDKVLLSYDLYGGTIELFDKVLKGLGIAFDFVNLNSPEELFELAKDGAYTALFFETPTNPLVKCYDISEISSICRQFNIKSIIDNTFCTAYLQQPLLLGIDFVIYSATKYLAGHGNCTAGAVIGADVDFMRNRFWQVLKLTGGICSPFEAWNLNNGLKTLSIRLDRHCSNAVALAQFLQEHPKIKSVFYPGLEQDSSHPIAKKQMSQYGGMLSFEVDSDFDSVLKFINALALITNAPTLGDVDSLLLHPYTSSHVNVDEEVKVQSGITEQLIRISVGIENKRDIMSDIQQALEQI